MLELYHNAVSTCSQKVRLVLAYKGLEFTSHEIDLISGGQHDPDYVKLNPNHVVPTLVHRGSTLIESTLINEYLDEMFPEIPMLPTAPAHRHAARLWTKLLDEKIHPVTATVTFAIGPRSLLLLQPEEVRENHINAIPNPIARAARRSVIELGVNAPEFAGAMSEMLKLLDRMQVVLSSHEWLAGDGFTLADAALLPYVLRLDALAMSPLIDARANVARWYARIRAMPAYDTAVARWTPEFVTQLFRANGEAVWSQVEALINKTLRAN
jgi:glutathione S-transferase